MVAMASLRARLVVLWLMFAASGAATAFLLLEYYQQSANAQVGRAEEVVSRACRGSAKQLNARLQIHARSARKSQHAPASECRTAPT
jgi:hypothetical protein